MDHYPSLEFLGTYIWELNPCVFSLDCDKNEQNGAEAGLLGGLTTVGMDATTCMPVWYFVIYRLLLHWK